MCFDIQTEMAQTAEPTDTTAQRTNQLLNELYHDRAKLERELEIARKLADDASEAIAALMDDLHDLDTNQIVTLTQVEMDLVINAAKLRQFAGN